MDYSFRLFYVFCFIFFMQIHSHCWQLNDALEDYKMVQSVNLLLSSRLNSLLLSSSCHSYLFSFYLLIFILFPPPPPPPPPPVRFFTSVLIARWTCNASLFLFIFRHTVTGVGVFCILSVAAVSAKRKIHTSRHCANTYIHMQVCLQISPCVYIHILCM